MFCSRHSERERLYAVRRIHVIGGCTLAIVWISGVVYSWVTTLFWCGVGVSKPQARKETQWLLRRKLI